MGAGQVMDRGVAAEAVTIKAPASAGLPAASTAATSTRATPSRTTQNSTRRATGINSPSLSREPHASRGQANMLDRQILLVKTKGCIQSSGIRRPGRQSGGFGRGELPTYEQEAGLGRKARRSRDRRRSGGVVGVFFGPFGVAAGRASCRPRPLGSR